MRLKDASIALACLVLLEGVARFWLGESKPRAGEILSMTVHHAIGLGGTSELLPLAGVSSSPTWLCSEAEGPVRFHSDRFGFNNEDSVWDSGVDTVLLGDSFIQGHCVSPSAQLASLIRARGEGVLNLGLKGTGPLSQLGVLEEYGLDASHSTSRAPRRIVWFLLANDWLYDIERELEEPQLLDYLNGKTQGLRRRQSEVDEFWQNAGSRANQSSYGELAFTSLVLRAIMHMARPEPLRPVETETKFEVEENEIRLAVEAYARGARWAEERGVTVEFVFVPDSWIFTPTKGAGVRVIVDRVKIRMKEKGLILVDPTAAFDREESPLRFFAALDGVYGHYDARGFELLAKSVPALKRQRRGQAATGNTASIRNSALPLGNSEPRNQH